MKTLSRKLALSASDLGCCVLLCMDADINTEIGRLLAQGNSDRDQKPDLHVYPAEEGFYNVIALTENGEAFLSLV